MSHIQQKDLRYLKRKNLNQESTIVGNWYRDLINSYGVDCVYNKLDTTAFENYKQIIDNNTLILRAYGINIDPDYSCSANMITFPEVEQDIFQLLKYGLNPLTDITFYFDSTDFACALAEKCGQFLEYKIKETDIVCEVPDCTDEIITYVDRKTGETIINYVSADLFPYNLGLGYAEKFECGVMTGKLSVMLDHYEYDKELTVMCEPYEHNDFIVEIPANKYLSKTLMHRLNNTQYLQSMVLLTFKVTKTAVGIDLKGLPIYKSILTGKVHGGVLFYSLNKIGKYIEKIHPEVGDLIAIDFPDELNRERYEITECFNKSLALDGISPLLHNYIWKCKAKRYINNYDQLEPNEADKRLEEKKEYQQVVDEIIAKKISGYENREDAAYGGYESHFDEFDLTKTNPYKEQHYDYIDDGTAIDILRFLCGSRLITDGYDLIFLKAPKGDESPEAIKVTSLDYKINVDDAIFESGTRWLKATDSCIVFINIHGESFKIVEDEVANNGLIEICLNSLFDLTLDPGMLNVNGQCFYIFKECKTLLWATGEELFCRLASNGKLYKLA